MLFHLAGAFGLPVGITVLSRLDRKRLSDHHFARAVNLLMIVSGISYFA
jgi:hypothetical protein